MSRRSYPWPPAHPSVEAIMALVPMLKARLERAGIPLQDRDDILQEALLGAFSAARKDRYRPDPRVEPDKMLRVWLNAIVFHQIEHYRKRAHRRREKLRPAPERAGVGSPETSAEAWRVLGALAALRPELREVVRLHAMGWEIQEIAVRMAISRTSAAKRLRAARKHLGRKGGR